MPKKLEKTMRLPVAATIALLGMMWVQEASAACAAFVCKHPICQYQVMSSAGPRMVRLVGGQRRLLSGLAPDAEYCDWQGGCVTPRRPVRSIGAC
jgi:hypothetical protein